MSFLFLIKFYLCFIYSILYMFTGLVGRCDFYLCIYTSIPWTLFMEPHMILLRNALINRSVYWLILSNLSSRVYPHSQYWGSTLSHVPNVRGAEVWGGQLWSSAPQHPEGTDRIALPGLWWGERQVSHLLPQQPSMQCYPHPTPFYHRERVKVMPGWVEDSKWLGSQGGCLLGF